jgi:long-chain acyl-CoA synthetase
MNLVAVIVPGIIFAVTVGFMGYFNVYGWALATLFVLIFFYVFLFQGLGKVKDSKVSYEVRKAKPGQGAPRRRIKDNKKLGKLYEHPPGYEHVKTCYDIFQSGVSINPNGDCMGVREKDKPYKWFTYKQINEKIHNVASGLYEVGLRPKDRIGFYAKNRLEWVVGAEACSAMSMTSVAIYDTLGVENREFVIKQSEIKGIFTTTSLLTNLIDLSDESKELLKHIVIMDENNLTDDHRSNAESAGYSIYGFNEFEQLGKEASHEPIKPSPDDLAILMYTSGTTSRPKGVMLNHSCMVAVLAGVCYDLDLNKNDSYLSYLPLAHILERAAESAHYLVGARIGFYQGEIRLLNDDIVHCKPTVYAGVPKVFQRVMNAIKQKISTQSMVTQIIFNICYSLKKRLIECNLPYGLLDKIVFNKVKASLGGNVRHIISGGAPLSGECHEFLRVCFSCSVMQGYGLTETCGGASLTPPKFNIPYEKAGAPLCCVEIKLVDSGKYKTSNNPSEGEVCIKGANVAKGYYLLDNKTAEAFVEEDDGIWFHTGDAGRWNPDGTLSIIGRTKDIFKLDTGEYVAPERLETKYASSKYIANIFVFGHSTQSHLVAIIVPDFQAAKDWAAANNVQINDEYDPPDAPPSICNNPDFKKDVIADLKSVAIDCKLQRYEQIPKIHLSPTFWTPELGLVTSALKNKRPILEEHFKK